MGWILPTAVLEYSLKHLRRTMRELLPLLPANARRFLLLFGVLSAVLSLLDAAALGVFALVLNQILKGGTMTLPVFGDVTQEFSLLILVVIGPGHDPEIRAEHLAPVGVHPQVRRL